MASEGESSTVKRKFKLLDRTTNLKPKLGQKGTSHVENMREVETNIFRDEGPIMNESGSRCNRPTTPFFGCHYKGGTWEELTLIEGDVPWIRTKQKGFSLRRSHGLAG